MKQSFPNYLLSKGFKCYRKYLNGIKDESLTETKYDNFFSTAHSWSWYFIFIKDNVKIVWGLSGVNHNPPTLLTRFVVHICHFRIINGKRNVDTEDIGMNDDYYYRMLPYVDYDELLYFITKTNEND